MPDRNDALAVTLAVTTALAAVVLAVIVAIVPARPAGTAATAPAGCSEWTDGCVACTRTAQGPACSTPGIACTRGPVRCTAR